MVRAHLRRTFFILGLVAPRFLAQTVEIDPNAPAPLIVHGPVALSSRESTVSTPMVLNNVTSPFDSGGVKLISYGSPQFLPLLTKEVSNEVRPSIEGVLPYTVAIQNNGAYPILGFAVSWTLTSPSGDIFTYSRTVFDPYKLIPVIPPGDFVLFTPSDYLGKSNLSKTQPLSSGILTEVSNLISDFQSQASVTISLQAILFSNGTSLGPDQFQSILKLKRMVQAEFDLYTELSSSGITKESLDVVQRLSQEGSDDSGKIDPYSYHYCRVQAAKELIAVLKETDLTKVTALVTRRLKSKPYNQLLSH